MTVVKLISPLSLFSKIFNMISKISPFSKIFKKISKILKIKINFPFSLISKIFNKISPFYKVFFLQNFQDFLHLLNFKDQN